TLAVNTQLPEDKGGANGKVVFIDTEGTFRAQRIRQIAEGIGANPEKEKIFYTSEIKVKNAASIKINSLFMRYDNHSAYFSLINVDSLYYTVLYNFKNGKSFIRQLEKERNEIISSFSIENKLVWYNKFLLINNSKNGIFVKLDTSNPNEFVFEKVEVPYTDNYFVTVIDKKPYLIYKVEDNIIKFKEIGGNK
nr:hypothetical protein [Melioribacteraceae bacterium]